MTGCTVSSPAHSHVKIKSESKNNYFSNVRFALKVKKQSASAVTFNNIETI